MNALREFEMYWAYRWHAPEIVKNSRNLLKVSHLNKFTRLFTLSEINAGLIQML